MSTEPTDEFDHTRYREEVTARWGSRAYARSDAWWRGLGADGQAAHKRLVEELNRDWQVAYAAQVDPHGPQAQALAERHANWLVGIPGTPRPLGRYLRGLAEMYVADERFAANYGGLPQARFVRAALEHYVDQLSD